LNRQSSGLKLPDFNAIASWPVPARLAIFTACLLALWSPFALPLYLWGGAAHLTGLVTMIILYGEFILLLRLWGRRLHNQPRSLQFYGWELSWRNLRELVLGLLVGFGLLNLLFLLQGGLGWLSWQAPTDNFRQIVLEGWAVGLAVGLAEELLFRGWLLQELATDYSLAKSLWLNGTIFALLHYIRPLNEILATWTQFVGLVLLGLILVWARRLCSGRLGLSTGLHGGLVAGFYLIRVGELIRYTHTVPEWVTGLHNNPLAGVMGLGLLGLLATTIFRLWRHQQRNLQRV
jgi:uncharacterized protein